ncbi:MAG: ferritin-like domain-containing protein [Opitutales bacterium]|jgi:ferritin-like metal-binding protein YciE
MRTLKNLFLDELADRYDGEKRLVIAMPKMIKAATCSHLRKLIESHLMETERQVEKLEQVFRLFGEKPSLNKCDATVGMLAEGAEVASDNKGSPVINAALISVAQKIEHYEIASYGCLHEWARLLDNKPAAALLKEILGEEKTANEALIELARSRSNNEALNAGTAADCCATPKTAKPVKRAA